MDDHQLEPFDVRTNGVARTIELVGHRQVARVQKL